MTTWKRLAEKDKRFRYGDDYAGDAWVNSETGEVKYYVVGYDPNGKKAQ